MKYYIIVNQHEVTTNLICKAVPVNLFEDGEQKVIGICDVNNEVYKDYVKYTQDEIINIRENGSLTDNKINSKPSPFNDPKYENKSIYTRLTGFELTSTIDSEVIADHLITQKTVLFTGLSIVNCVAMDKVTLQVGVLSGETFKVYNEFGTNVSLPLAFYEFKSNYAAKLQLGLTIRVKYTGTSTNKIGINLMLHEAI